MVVVVAWVVEVAKMVDVTWVVVKCVVGNMELPVMVTVDVARDTLVDVTNTGEVIWLVEVRVVLCELVLVCERLLVVCNRLEVV